MTIERSPKDESGLLRKARELHNFHFDSTTWNGFLLRDDDVTIGTYGKSGATSTQQIVGRLVFSGDENINLADMSRWLAHGSQ